MLGDVDEKVLLENASDFFEKKMETLNRDIKIRYQKANEEFQVLLKWANAEMEKITLKFKEENKYVTGLDTNQKAYLPVQEEFKRKTLAIFDKYNLPNKPKW